MKTRQEIEEIVGGYRENERPPKIAEALLEVMLDIRDALLDPEGTKKAFDDIADRVIEDNKELLVKIGSEKGSGHPGWTCDDAHQNMTHEEWLHMGQESPDGLEFGGAADQVAEAKAEMQAGQDPYEANEIEDNSLDAADQQDHTEVEYP